MAIVGASGSPIQDGNTDRLVRSLPEQSDHETEGVDSALRGETSEVKTSVAYSRECLHARDGYLPWTTFVLLLSARFRGRWTSAPSLVIAMVSPHHPTTTGEGRTQRVRRGDAAIP